MNVLRNLIVPLAAVVTLPRPGEPQLPQPVPTQDQVAIYSAVLRAEVTRLTGPLARLPLLLVVTPSPKGPIPDTSRVTDSSGQFPDSAVAAALVNARVVAALCRPLAADRCSGAERGLGARLGPIQLTDSTHALVVVTLLIMQARRDNAWLVGNGDRGGVWRLERVAGRWETTVRPGRLPP